MYYIYFFLIIFTGISASCGLNENSEKMDTSEPIQPGNNNTSLTLFLCGDVMTGRGIDQALPNSADPVLYEPYIKDARSYLKLAEEANGKIPAPADYSYIWGDASEVWSQRKPALKIINLETSITKYNEPWPRKGINYRMHPDNVKILKAAGIDFCSLANNHTLDWQFKGLEETIKTLDETNIAHAGAGKDLGKASQPVVLPAKTTRVLIYACGTESSGISLTWQATEHNPGLNLLTQPDSREVERIFKDISKVKQPGDIVIISIHWGSNWGFDITPQQQTLARSLIDEAGADIVHGHSSHHPRPLEVYKNRLIIYGAGDFINDYEGIRGHEQYRGDLTLMYFPALNPATGELLSLEMIPMQIRNFRLNYASAADTEWLRQVLNRESRKFGVRVELRKGKMLKLQWD